MRRIIKKNPTMQVNHKQINLNIISVVGLVICSFNVSGQEVNWIDVSENFIAIFIQMNILGFCWKLVTKNDPVP